MNDTISAKDVVDSSLIHQLLGHIQTFLLIRLQMRIDRDLEHRVHIEEVAKQDVDVLGNRRI